ncbi:MAG: RNA ligase partner protein [Crenarchaeota archaeon]|nr:RNA ligase partner protein [Thermoproteota archaeon]
MPDIYVLDTSAFTDPRLREKLGTNTLNDTIIALIDLLAKARARLGLSLYIPPTTAEELRRFLIRNKVDKTVVDKLISVLTVRSPDLYGIKLPAIILSNWIKDLKTRITKGLRVAEDMVRKTIKLGYEAKQEDELDAILAESIHDLREKYREATRKGIVDTDVDLDIIILAFELGGEVVTNDEGIMRMCRELGVRYIDPISFVNRIEMMLESLG